MGYLGLSRRAICLANLDNQILFVTMPFVRLFGYELPRDMLGLELSCLIAPDTVHPHAQEMSDWVPEHETAIRFSLDGVVRAVKADGTRFDVIISERQIFEAGNHNFMSCVARLPDPTTLPAKEPSP